MAVAGRTLRRYVQGAVVLAWVDLGLSATGSIGACAPVRYNSRTACEGQLHVLGAGYQSDGEGWADTRQRYSHQGEGGTKVNLIPYPKLFAYDLLHTFHRFPSRCVPCPQRPTAVSTTPRANHHLHGRCLGDSGAAVAVAGTDAVAAADGTAAVDAGAAGIVGAAAADTAGVVAAAGVVGAAAADAAGVDAAAVDAAAAATAGPHSAAAVVVAAVADTAGLPYLHPVCPCRVRLGLLFLQPRCIDHPSRQQKVVSLPVSRPLLHGHLHLTSTTSSRTFRLNPSLASKILFFTE